MSDSSNSDPNPNESPNALHQLLFYTNSSVYCGDGWRSFWLEYSLKVDFHVTTALAVIGIVTNIINILVFSQREMRKSPLMRILMALAIADLFQSVRRLSFNTVLYFSGEYGKIWTVNSYTILVVTLIFGFFVPVFHSWTIYLTLCAALWRWLGVLHPLKSRRWLTNKMAKTIIIVSVVWATVIASSVLLLMDIQPVNSNPSSGNNNNTNNNSNSQGEGNEYNLLDVVQGYNNTVISIIKENFPNFFDLEQKAIKSDGSSNETDQNLYKFVFHEKGGMIYGIMNAFLMKLGPCVILAVATVGLLLSLFKIRRNRRELFEGGYRKRTYSNISTSSTVDSISIKTVSLATLSPSQSQSKDDLSQSLRRMSISNAMSASRKSQNQNQSQGEDRIQSSRTTLMLIVILLIFLVTEIPPGIMMVILSIYGNIFLYECGLWMGTFVQMLELSSSATNFFVYIGLSGKYRRGFITMYMKTRKLLRL